MLHAQQECQIQLASGTMAIYRLQDTLKPGNLNAANLIRKPQDSVAGIKFPVKCICGMSHNATNRISKEMFTLLILLP